MNMKLEDYELQCILGCHGGSSDFSYLMKSKINNQLLVWKPIDCDLNEENQKAIEYDLKLLVQVNHPNIAKYHNCILSLDTNLYIVSEFCQGVDLATIIQRRISSRAPLPEEFICRVLYQVSKAVQAVRIKLKGLTVLSFKIKPENVFIKNQYNLKLGNFGLAKNKNSRSLLRVGTSKNSEQEVVMGHTCSDICYLEKLVYQMCTLSPSFDNGVNICCAKTRTDECAETPSFYSKDLRHLVYTMRNAIKNNFTSVDFILYHPTVIRYAVPSVPPVRDIKTSDLYVFKNLNVPTNDETEECRTLKRKWFEKVSVIRAKESELNLRESNLDLREKALLEKEEKIKLLQFEADLKFKLAKKLNKIKQSQLHHHKNKTDSNNEADNVKTRPTTAKINFDQLTKPNFHKKKFIANEGRSTKTNVTSEDKTWSECIKRHQQAILLQQTDKILVKTNFQHDDTFRITKFS